MDLNHDTTQYSSTVYIDIVHENHVHSTLAKQEFEEQKDTHPINPFHINILYVVESINFNTHRSQPHSLKSEISSGLTARWNVGEVW